jgi:hypothetical protein
MADKIRIGKLVSKNVVVGREGKITDKSEILIASPAQSELQAEAIRQLHDFMELLPAYSHEIDVAPAHQAAKELESALNKRRLRRAKLENWFNVILSAIGGVSALAGAIGTVQATVGQLMS